MHSIFMFVVVVLGGFFGYLLTVGAPLSWFMPLGILVGVAVAIVLIFRIEHLSQQSGP